jgi:RNA polymerase sigma-70 factor (ECF subfamily)
MSMRRAHIPLSLVTKAVGERISNADLGRALVAGAAWAYAETWNRFAPVVRKMAFSTLGSEAEADDVVQEVFCRLARKASTLRKPEALHSFVVSFAIRVLKWELRRKRAHAWLSFAAPETLTDKVDVSLDVESRDLLRRFYGLLDKLTPRERLVYALRNMESMTIEEAAEAMQISVSTVKRLQDRATKALTALLDADLELLACLRRKRGRYGI